MPKKEPPHAVFKVLVPMPELGARPGDFLYAEPGEASYPLVLHRHFDRNYLGYVRDSRVTQLSGIVVEVRPSLTVCGGGACV